MLLTDVPAARPFDDACPMPPQAPVARPCQRLQYHDDLQPDLPPARLHAPQPLPCLHGLLLLSTRPGLIHPAGLSLVVHLLLLYFSLLFVTVVADILSTFISYRPPLHFNSAWSCHSPSVVYGQLTIREGATLRQLFPESDCIGTATSPHCTQRHITAASMSLADSDTSTKAATRGSLGALVAPINAIFVSRDAARRKSADRAASTSSSLPNPRSRRTHSTSNATMLSVEDYDGLSSSIKSVVTSPILSLRHLHPIMPISSAPRPIADHVQQEKVFLASRATAHCPAYRKLQAAKADPRRSIPLVFALPEHRL